ncbi:MAG: GntR family transcriptional regulator [Gammaproteobacteria bacterium]|nr:GntR family transcriptional regulator [Gammaproteobacteria bacterium]MCP5198405.1 GntR family transcriptional regulator [Gammaproteobacteria bacterium]
MAERAPPRYRRLAESLRAEIACGRLGPGAALPTEKELCAAHGVSRHTAREALRILAEDGLIERRQGAGSVVSAPPSPAFAQPTGDFDSILQYAREARFVLEQSGAADAATLRRAGLGGDYRAYSGLRRVAGQVPLAFTTILVAREFAPADAVVDDLNEAVSEWIERHHGLRIELVEQRIEAVALAARPAARLGVAAGSPALRTERRYLDRAAVVLYSESLHPAGRFAYTLRLRRER